MSLNKKKTHHDVCNSRVEAKHAHRGRAGRYRDAKTYLRDGAFKVHNGKKSIVQLIRINIPFVMLHEI